MPYTPAEFASQVRKKYPEYSQAPWDKDEVLVKAVLDKYPEYKDWVKFTPVKPVTMREDLKGSIRPSTFMEKVKDVFTSRGTKTESSGESGPDQPLIDLEQLRTEPGVVKGVLKGVSQLTTPTSLLMAAGTGGVGKVLKTLGQSGIARLISAGFTLDMIRGFYSNSKEFAAAIDRGDAGAALTTLGEMGVEGVMAFLPGKHAAVPEKLPAVKPTAEMTAQEATRRLADLRGVVSGQNKVEGTGFLRRPKTFDQLTEEQKKTLRSEASSLVNRQAAANKAEVAAFKTIADIKEEMKRLTARYQDRHLSDTERKLMDSRFGMLANRIKVLTRSLDKPTATVEIPRPNSELREDKANSPQVPADPGFIETKPGDLTVRDSKPKVDVISPGLFADMGPMPGQKPRFYAEPVSPGSEVWQIVDSKTGRVVKFGLSQDEALRRAWNMHGSSKYDQAEWERRQSHILGAGDRTVTLREPSVQLNYDSMFDDDPPGNRPGPKKKASSLVPQPTPAPVKQGEWWQLLRSHLGILARNKSISEVMQSSYDIVNSALRRRKLNEFFSGRVVDQIYRSLPVDSRKVGGELHEALVGKGKVPAHLVDAVQALRTLRDGQYDLLKQVFGQNIPEVYRNLWEFTKPEEGQPDDILSQINKNSNFLADQIFKYEIGVKLFDNGLVVRPDADVTAEWKPFSDPMLNRAVYRKEGGDFETPEDIAEIEEELGQPLIPKGNRKGNAYHTYKAPLIHPEAMRAVQAVYNSKPNEGIFHALDQLRALGKRTKLFFSIFHPNALSEQTHGLQTGLAIQRALMGDFAGAKEALGKGLRGTWFFDPESYKGVRTGILESLGKEGKAEAPPIYRYNPALVEDAIRHGLELSTDDAERQVYQIFENTRNSRLARYTGVEALGKAVYIWDRALWDFYHQGSMLTAYESILSNELGRLGPEATPEQIAKVKTSIAHNVNASYGAINWQSLLVSRRMQNVLNWTLLAPSWTFSNVRVFSQAFENATGMKLASRYALGAFLSWFTTTQMLNYALTKYYGEKDRNGKVGRFTWDNPGQPFKVFDLKVPGLTDNVFNVFGGYNYDSKGNRTTEKYIKIGRGFREPFLWVTDFTGTLFNKGGQFPKSLYEFFKTRDENKRLGRSFKDSVTRHIGDFAEMLMPIPGSEINRKLMHKGAPTLFPPSTSSQQIFGLPTSPGLTKADAIRAYKAALESNDTAAMQVIIRAAQANRLDVKAIITQARRNISKEKNLIKKAAEE